MDASRAEQFEKLIWRDPGRRGLCSGPGPRLCPGDLAAAVEHLAREGSAVAVVTGFYIPEGQPPAVETDGLIGSLFLASVLRALGMEAWLITDRYGRSALQEGMGVIGLPCTVLLEFPLEAGSPVADSAVAGANVETGRSPLEWVQEFFRAGPGGTLTHLIAVERVGPSHHLASLQGQVRTESAPLESFRQEVPPSSYDQCHNMAGRNITEWTAPIHLLFEYVQQQCLPITTIGIGDGGNEIGMGKIPWEELRRRVPAEHAGRIFCRVPTDYTIVGGTSNWGAHAVGAGVLAHRRRLSFLDRWDHDFEFDLLKHLVERGPAVDGVTRRREPTIDGLPFETYYQIIEGIRQLLSGRGV